MPQAHIRRSHKVCSRNVKALEEHEDIFKDLYVEYDGTRKNQSAGYGDAGAGQATRRRIRSRLSRWWKRMAFFSGATAFPASGSSHASQARAGAGLPPAPDGTLVLAKAVSGAGAEQGNCRDRHHRPAPQPIDPERRFARDCGHCGRNPTTNLFSTTTDVAGPFCRPDAAVRAWDLLERRQHARGVHRDVPWQGFPQCG